MNRLLLTGVVALMLISPAIAEDDPVKEALQKLNDYIGSWKGAGGPDRTSAPANWRENIAWGWRFKGGTAIVGEFKDAKYFKTAEMTYLPDKKKYQLTLTDKKDVQQVFQGERNKKGYLVLERVDAKSGETFRVQMNTAAEGIRLNYTMYRKNKGSTVFNELYKVQLGKEGVSLAGGGKQRECVVTGGLGTIAVSYNGKTYYVCCSGCRDAFNENPAKILKEYEERKKKEQ